MLFVPSGRAELFLLAAVGAIAVTYRTKYQYTLPLVLVLQAQVPLTRSTTVYSTGLLQLWVGVYV